MSQYLGDISAYALAVSQGYTGTEEEYAELMASYATVGQTAVTAAQTATTKASEAATNADRAEQAAGQSGYMFFYIDENGDLRYQRTDNVDVDFYLNDGDLYVRADA